MHSNINSDNIYNVINKHGIVEIFNHTTFSDSAAYNDRFGTNIDVENLEKSLNLYPTKLTINTDFTIQQIVDRINALGSIEMDVAFVMVIFLTYGEKHDHLVAYDGLFPADNLIQIFCENLTIFAGKPKIFIINASRGGNLDQGFTIYDNSISVANLSLSGPSNQLNANIKLPLPIRSLFSVVPKLTINDLKVGFSQNNSYEVSYVIPRYADTIIVNSTFKGFISFRNDDGSFLIQSLCEVLNDCKHEISDLYDILTKTIAKVSLKKADSFGVLHEKKQIPVFLSTFRKRLLLIPKSLNPSDNNNNNNHE